jgi:hypothetical protein
MSTEYPYGRRTLQDKGNKRTNPSEIQDRSPRDVQPFENVYASGAGQLAALAEPSPTAV